MNVLFFVLYLAATILFAVASFSGGANGDGTRATRFHFGWLGATLIGVVLTIQAARGL